MSVISGLIFLFTVYILTPLRPRSDSAALYWYPIKLGNWLQVSTSQKFVVVQVRAIYKDSNGKKAYSAWATFRDVGCTRVSATFDPNGGKIGGTREARKVTFIKTKPLITSSNFLNGKLYTPTRKGYTFKGWYYIKGGRWTKATINTSLAPNTRVCAKWQKNK